MASSSCLNPFVSKFLKPIISQEDEMLLLRFKREDGSTGCIGIRKEALETLHEAMFEAQKKMDPKIEENRCTLTRIK